MAAIPQAVSLGPWISMTGSKRMGILMAYPHRNDLDLAKELLETGQVVPATDRRYPLGEVAEALRYLKEGHHQGKVVTTM
jgi:NADPH:quinone reductase-like Zn-dependent oxidoreductase